MKHDYRANILFGSDEDYYQKYYANKDINTNWDYAKKRNREEVIKRKFKYIPQQVNSKLPDISNPDMLLFKNGNIAEMPLTKNFDLTKDYDEINNVKYPKNNNDINALKEKANQELFNIEKERWLNHAKNWGGAALEIISAAIPMGGSSRIAQ